MDVKKHTADLSRIGKRIPCYFHEMRGQQSPRSSVHSTPLLSQSPRERSSGPRTRTEPPTTRRRDGHFRMAKNLGPELWIFSEAAADAAAVIAIQRQRPNRGHWTRHLMPEAVRVRSSVRVRLTVNLEIIFSLRFQTEK